MEIDRHRIDEAILALLFLGRHDDIRAWKSFDWAAMERLHTKGFIPDPSALPLRAAEKRTWFFDRFVPQVDTSFAGSP